MAESKNNDQMHVPFVISGMEALSSLILASSPRAAEKGVLERDKLPVLSTESGPIALSVCTPAYVVEPIEATSEDMIGWLRLVRDP